MKAFKCVKPSNHKELKELVSDFVDSQDKEKVRKAVWNMRLTNKLCIKINLNNLKYKRGTIQGLREVIWMTPRETLGVLPVLLIFGLWECFPVLPYHTTGKN